MLREHARPAEGCSSRWREGPWPAATDFLCQRRWLWVGNSQNGHLFPTQDPAAWPYCRLIHALLTWLVTLRQGAGSVGGAAGTKRKGVRDERRGRACQQGEPASSGHRLPLGIDAVLAADVRAQHAWWQSSRRSTLCLRPSAAGSPRTGEPARARHLRAARQPPQPAQRTPIFRPSQPGVCLAGGTEFGHLASSAPRICLPAAWCVEEGMTGQGGLLPHPPPHFCNVVVVCCACAVRANGRCDET